jgi:hypothetical protein
MSSSRMARIITAHQHSNRPGVTARQRIGVALPEFREHAKLRENYPALMEPRPTKSSLFSHVDR